MTPSWDLPGGCDCGRRWQGFSEAHCPICHEHFTSDSAFTRHLSGAQVDDPLCYPPESFRKQDDSPVFEQIDRVHGPTWRIVNTNPHFFSLAAKKETKW